MISVLLIDDDTALAELLADYLGQEGFAVHHLADGRRSLAMRAETRAEVVVLDIMMPGLSGIEVLRRIRRESNVPVLMLTARGDGVDRIAGLDLGADDYLAKPCSPGELAARIADETGLTYFTEAVEGLTLTRDGLSVELCQPYDVPKKWVTRSGEKAERFRPGGDLSPGRAAP